MKIINTWNKEKKVAISFERIHFWCFDLKQLISSFDFDFKIILIFTTLRLWVFILEMKVLKQFSVFLNYLYLTSFFRSNQKWNNLKANLFSKEPSNIKKTKNMSRKNNKLLLIFFVSMDEFLYEYSINLGSSDANREIFFGFYENILISY
jgi:hypothetical protein